MPAGTFQRAQCSSPKEYRESLRPISQTRGRRSLRPRGCRTRMFSRVALRKSKTLQTRFAPHPKTAVRAQRPSLNNSAKQNLLPCPRSNFLQKQLFSGQILRNLRQFHLGLPGAGLRLNSGVKVVPKVKLMPSRGLDYITHIPVASLEKQHRSRVFARIGSRLYPSCFPSK